jgi:hypothetical protein
MQDNFVIEQLAFVALCFDNEKIQLEKFLLTRQ